MMRRTLFGMLLLTFATVASAADDPYKFTMPPGTGPAANRNTAQNYGSGAPGAATAAAPSATRAQSAFDLPPAPKPFTGASGSVQPLSQTPTQPKTRPLTSQTSPPANQFNTRPMSQPLTQNNGLGGQPPAPTTLPQRNTVAPFGQPVTASTPPIGTAPISSTAAAPFTSQQYTTPAPGGSIQPRNLPMSAQTVGGTVTGGLTAQLMIEKMLAAPTNSEVLGNPTSLAQAVAYGKDRTEQGAIVDAYWDLCASLADYYLSLREAGELTALANKVPNLSTSLQQAGGELRNRIDTSRTAALAAQYRLSSYMGGAARPLPSDMPFCGAYNTKHQEIFQGRASAEADQLVRLIPSRFAEMNAAANSVERSVEWLGRVERDPQVTTDGVVRSLELLALNRRAFVQLVKDYNRRINRYTQLSRPDKVEINRLVAMLVERPGGVATASRVGATSGNLNWGSATQNSADPYSRYGTSGVR